MVFNLHHIQGYFSSQNHNQLIQKIKYCNYITFIDGTLKGNLYIM